ncbi:hypothetical protein [Agromyces bracchium]|uniref:Uncharacterized protein n=1 Tax=Agromyces bracchium TaxID=88376 RepID=A0A6I3LZ48_9MICO|nr:hypothetical protein [Agromyces bracchium]MTH67810.1 hypothetical protein [Agromyces bracchium]
MRGADPFERTAREVGLFERIPNEHPLRGGGGKGDAGYFSTAGRDETVTWFGDGGHAEC